MLRELTRRLSNLAIAKICHVSEAAVRKWLREHGIKRETQIHTGNLSDFEIALLRAELQRQLQSSMTGKPGVREGD
jgi:hypothetical protein